MAQNETRTPQESSQDSQPSPTNAHGTAAYRTVLAATCVCLASIPLALVVPLFFLAAALVPLGLGGMVATFVLARRAGKSTTHAVVAALSPVLILMVASVLLAVIVVLLVIVGAGNSGYL